MIDQHAAPKFIAKVLELEFGAAPHLQIGLFEGKESSLQTLPAAQVEFAQFIQKTLVATLSPASRVLLAGEALAVLALNLGQQGVDTLWLSNQWTSSQQTADTPSLTVLPETLLDYRGSTNFDCIVVAGSYRYLDQLPILSRCRELLTVKGQLLVFGEFLQDDSSIGYSALANLSSRNQLAQRLGYRERAILDLSSSALQSVHFFNELLAKHKLQVATSLKLNEADLQQQISKFETMEQDLQIQQRCFQLVHWELPELEQNEALGEYARAEYGDIDSFDPAAISNLFEQCFDKTFNPELWQWKYGQGAGKSVVARVEPAGDIVAHYGGAPRSILYFGEPAMAIQVCDVMVLPEKRKQYGKSSLFFKTAATFLEREIGHNVNHLLGFGFPNQKAMNIAIRLGLYHKTDDFVEVDFSAITDCNNDLECQTLDFTDASSEQQLDALWQAMMPDFQSGIIGLRDFNYIKYRYFDHPYGKAGLYRCLLIGATDSEKALACAVLKQHGDVQLLVDLICPVAQMSSVISSVNQLLNQESSAQGLRMWVTRGWLAAIEMPGAIVNELGIEIPCNSWNPGPSAETLAGKWWLTAGDMDFM